MVSPEYQDGRIARLAAQLAKAVSPDIAARIMEGGEAILRTTKPERKAAWFRDAMARMDTLLDPATRHSIRENCACCLSGQRLKISSGIGRAGGTLEERIAAANKASFVFGNSVTLQDDGTVLVAFNPEGLPDYRCVCLPRSQEPVSATYCYCCAGHVKHHLQYALGLRLEVTVRSSALASGGRQSCSFVFRVVG